MAHSPTDRAEPAEPPTPLPDDSVLALEDYLAMQRSIGDPTRFRVLRTLVHNGDLSAKELETALDLRGNTLHYHLRELVDVGLVQNRKWKEPNQSGLYSYYRATTLGEGILEHGVTELMRREQDYLEVYS